MISKYCLRGIGEALGYDEMLKVKNRGQILINSKLLLVLYLWQYVIQLSLKKIVISFY